MQIKEGYFKEIKDLRRCIGRGERISRVRKVEGKRSWEGKGTEIEITGGCGKNGGGGGEGVSPKQGRGLSLSLTKRKGELQLQESAK